MSINPEGLLEKLKLQGGLQFSEWNSLWMQRQEIGLAERAELVPYALDCGEYKLALALAESQSYHGNYASYFVGERPLVIPQEPDLKPEGSFESIVLYLLHLRFSGRLREGVQWIEGLLLAFLDEAELKAPMPLLGELWQQIGAIYFHHSKYIKAHKFFVRAYHEFEGRNNPTKQAINAFNAAVSAHYFSLEFEHKKWAEKAHEILLQVPVPNLLVSLKIFEADCLYHESRFAESVKVLSAIRKQEGLSLVQSTLVELYQARSEVERGEILLAGLSLSRASRFLEGQGAQQFRPFRLALQNEVSFQMNQPSVRFSAAVKDSRYASMQDLVGLREQVLEESPRKLMRQMAQFTSKYDEAILSYHLSGDLHFNLNPSMSELGAYPRLQWQQVLWACRQNNQTYLRYLRDCFIETLNSDSSPWEKIGFSLTKIILEKNQFHSVRVIAEQSYHLCLENGMNWQAGFFLGLLCFHDPSRQMEWLDYLNSLEPKKRSYLRCFFKEALGQDVASVVWMVKSTNGGELAQADHNLSAESLIDVVNKQVRFAEQVFDLKSQAKVFQCLLGVAEARSKGIAKEELCLKVWGVSYRPLEHDPMIYRCVQRLREYIPVDSVDGHYRLPDAEQWVILYPIESSREMNLNLRQRQLVDLCRERSSQGLGRKQASGHLGVSPRTVLRDLNEMVDKRIMQRVGSGRSTRYYLKDGL